MTTNTMLLDLMRRPGESFGGTTVVANTLANPNSQPPRLYATFVTDGGVLSRYEDVPTFQSRGFDVQQIDLDAQEMQYLTQNFRQAAWSRQAWLVTCPGGHAYYDESGQRICGSIPGVERVSEQQAIDSGIDIKDYRPTLRLLPSIDKLRYRYFLPTSDATQAERLAAQDAVVAYGRVLALAGRMQPLVEGMWDSPLLPMNVRGPYIAAVRMLAKLAQPVEEWRKLQRNAPVRIGGSSPRFGLAPIVAGFLWSVGAVIVLICVGTAAAKILAASSIEVKKTEIDFQGAWDESARWAQDALNDPRLTPAERRKLLSYLEQHEKNRPKPSGGDPLVVMEKLIEAAVPMAMIGMAVVFGAPLISQAGKAAGESVARFRKRRAEQE